MASLVLKGILLLSLHCRLWGYTSGENCAFKDAYNLPVYYPEYFTTPSRVVRESGSSAGDMQDKVIGSILPSAAGDIKLPGTATHDNARIQAAVRCSNPSVAGLHSLPCMLVVSCRQPDALRSGCTLSQALLIVVCTLCGCAACRSSAFQLMQQSRALQMMV